MGKCESFVKFLIDIVINVFSNVKRRSIFLSVSLFLSALSTFNLPTSIKIHGFVSTNLRTLSSIISKDYSECDLSSKLKSPHLNLANYPMQVETDSILSKYTWQMFFTLFRIFISLRHSYITRTYRKSYFHFYLKTP